MDQVINNMSKSLDFLRTNTYASAATSLFLVLYAGMAAPALPASIAGLFEHDLFKFLILSSVLVFLNNQSPTNALLIAIGFVISMSTLSKYHIFTMANQMMSHGLVGNTEVPVKDTSRGPNGVRPRAPSESSEWSAESGVNRLSVRGYDYTSDDESNHLPGGHGSSAPVGLTGAPMAGIGQPNSQL